MIRAARDPRRSPAGRAAAAALIYLSILCQAPAAWTEPGDAARAELLVRQGRELVSNATEARRYAERALEFLEGSPDAHALLGEIALRQGRWDLVVSELGQALGRAPLVVYDSAAVRSDLARALIRVRRFADALTVLGSLGPASTSDALLLGSQASVGLGRSEDARRHLHDLTRVYPGVAEGWVALAELERSLDRFADARAALDAGVSRHPQSPALHLAFVAGERTAAARAAALDRYFALPGRPAVYDARAAVLGARLDPTRTTLYLDRFLAADGLKFAELAVALAAELTQEPAEAERLDAATGAWSGSRTFDADGDGVAEYRYIYRGGVPQVWASDLDQDGVEELVVTCDERGGPREAVFRRLDELPAPTALVLTYGEYPWLVRAKYATATHERTYDLVPRSLRMRLQTVGEEPPRLPADLRPPREAEIRGAASVYRDQRAGTDAPAATATLRDGRVVRVESDADLDGSVDHVVRYREGSPELGERDLDSDGVFETREYYVSGSLERLEIDTDGDGDPDYVRRPGDPGVQGWDLDRDGEPDVERTAAVLAQLRRMYGALVGGGSR